MSPAAEPERAAIGRRRARPGARHALGSVFVHVLAIALWIGVAGARPSAPDFISYQIELISLPTEEVGEVVVEAPPTLPELTPPPAPVESEPEDPLPVEPEPERTRSDPPQPSPTPPTPTRAESADALSVRIEGLRRDYPAYYDNVILQIKRCFRWSGQGAPETEVYFVINEDGSVSDPRFVRQSGNPAFDYEALGAVECAGQPGRFGRLPDDLPYDRLPIRFTFRSAGIFR